MARTWHFSRRNFNASEFYARMFNSGFRTLLFTMTINRFNQTATKARVSRAKSTRLRIFTPRPRNCVFFGIRGFVDRASRYIKIYIFQVLTRLQKTDRHTMREGTRTVYVGTIGICKIKIILSIWENRIFTPHFFYHTQVHVNLNFYTVS